MKRSLKPSQTLYPLRITPFPFPRNPGRSSATTAIMWWMMVWVMTADRRRWLASARPPQLCSVFEPLPPFRRGSSDDFFSWLERFRKTLLHVSRSGTYKQQQFFRFFWRGWGGGRVIIYYTLHCIALWLKNTAPSVGSDFGANCS